MGRKSRKQYVAAAIEAARLKNEATLPPPPDVVQSVETAQSQTVVSMSDQERIQREREQQVQDQAKSLADLRAQLDAQKTTLDQQEADRRAQDDAPYPPRREKRRYADAPDAGPDAGDAAAPDQAFADAPPPPPPSSDGSSVLTIVAAAAAYLVFGR